jgi:hypothetical protein
MSRNPAQDLLRSPEEEISELKRKLEEKEQKRKKIFEESKQVSSQNKETILRLKTEQKNLLANIKGLSKQFESEVAKVKPEETEEIIKLRRRLDHVHSQYLSRKRELKTINDKLNEIPSEPKGAAVTDENPLNRQIRMLENRLDKAMIKYNEAQSIKKTYEQIVKQLKQERVAYDNQLAAIERSLRGKEHDFEELTLLSHDAKHARQAAEAEKCRFEAQVTVERMTREQNVKEKKFEVNKRIEATRNLEIADKRKGREELEPKEMLSKFTAGIASHAFADQKVKEEKQKIKDYESAFRRIKEATGVSDVNEIIQKFNTQEETLANLEGLRRENQNRIENLNERKGELKRQADGIKYNLKGDVESKKVLEEAEERLAKAMKRYEKGKAKVERINDIHQETRTGVEHIALLLENVKLEGQSNIPVKEDSLVNVLVQNRSKMEKIYFAVKESDIFSNIERNTKLLSKPADTAKRTAAFLQAIRSVPELSASSRFMDEGNIDNCRVRGYQKEEEDDFSDENPEDNLNLNLGSRDKSGKDSTMKMERLSKGLRVRRASSAVGKKRKF